MSDDRFDETQVESGRRLLETHMQQPPSATQAPGAPPFGYICAANLDALVVQRHKGGWVAGVLFKNVPEGYPDIIGSPDGGPFGTYEAALRHGLTIVDGLRVLPPPLAANAGPYVALAYRL